MDNVTLGLTDLTVSFTKILAQTGSSYSTSADGGISLLQIIFGLVGYIFGSYCFQRVFQRLGMENAWLAWVPVANTWMTYRAGEQSVWWTLAIFIPLINLFALVFLIVALVVIFKKLGKSPWLLLLFLVPIVNFWLMYHLAFN